MDGTLIGYCFVGPCKPIANAVRAVSAAEPRSELRGYAQKNHFAITQIIQKRFVIKIELQEIGMKNLFVVMVLIMSLLLISCEMFVRATPIPRDKEVFIGKWKSSSGFMIEIKPNGMANLLHNLGNSDPEYDKLCIKVGPSVIKDILVKFTGDSTLKVVKPTVYAKDYRIERFPYLENNQLKMVLNDVTLVKQ